MSDQYGNSVAEQQCGVKLCWRPLATLGPYDVASPDVVVSLPSKQKSFTFVLLACVSFELSSPGSTGLIL